MNVYICEATKNKFAILDGTASSKGFLELEKFKSKLKDISSKENCDGFIFLYQTLNHKKDFYDWTFFNKDGSSAEMCGNAARCIAKILQSTKNVYESTLISSSIEYKLLMQDSDTAQVTFPKQFYLQKLNLHLDTLIKGFYTNTGVPHFVLKQEPDIHLAKKIRNSLHFPNGTNVTFVFDQESKDTFYASTYERGVEGFTAACGTGAVAAGTYLFYKENLESSCIKMSGGNLKVKISDNESILIGDAYITQSIKINSDGLK